MRRFQPLIAAAVLAAVVGGCGEGDEGGADSPAPKPQAADERPQSPPKEPPEDHHDAPKPPPGEGEERVVIRVVRDYVRALDDRDGGRVCDLLAPGAIVELELPRERGGCPSSLTASIGYRDPRGLPVWRTARVGEIVSAEVDGDTAKVVATTITLFADREEPSIEDDVVYLAQRGMRWVIAKPSTTLYRAVGIADIPPSVLAPP